MKSSPPMFMAVECTPDTGDCCYIDDVGSTCMIAGLSIHNPIPVGDINHLVEPGYIGVLCAADSEYHIKDEEHVECVHNDGSSEDFLVNIYADCDADYEGESTHA